MIRDWLPPVRPLSICPTAGGLVQAGACGAEGGRVGGSQRSTGRLTDKQQRGQGVETRARARDQSPTELEGGQPGGGGRKWRAGRRGGRPARSCCGGRGRAGRRVSAPGPVWGALPFSECSQPEPAGHPGSQAAPVVLGSSVSQLGPTLAGGDSPGPPAWPRGTRVQRRGRAGDSSH